MAASFWANAVLFLILAVAAAWWDIRQRRIPNPLSGGGLLVALAAAALGGGWHALRGALEGAALFGGPLLLFWTQGWCGAGDAKLGFALGAFLGAPLSLAGLLFGTLLGGTFAALQVACSLLRRAPELLGAMRRYGVRAPLAVAIDPAWSVLLPYGAFLAGGALVARATELLSMGVLR